MKKEEFNEYIFRISNKTYSAYARTVKEAEGRLQAALRGPNLPIYQFGRPRKYHFENPQTFLIRVKPMKRGFGFY